MRKINQNTSLKEALVNFLPLTFVDYVFDLINQTIYEQIHSGEMFYDCWEISDTDFKAYKNNFVINDNAIEFYFDDCIICPSYTGQYSVVIPLIEIMHLIERYQQPLLLASR